jgi:hypothetical protein
LAGGSAVLQSLGEGWEIDFSDYKTEDAKLKGDYL